MIDTPDPRVRVLFVCIANATRSQMAESWTRTLRADRIDPYSAGVRPLGRVSQRAVRVMEEVGVDMSRQWSKGLDEWPGLTFDYVVVLCDHADELCPDFPQPTRRVVHPVPDPSGIWGTDDQVMSAFRKVREMLRLYVMSLPDALAEESAHNEFWSQDGQ
jgi:arsenate reductase